MIPHSLICMRSVRLSAWRSQPHTAVHWTKVKAHAKAIGSYIIPCSWRAALELHDSYSDECDPHYIFPEQSPHITRQFISPLFRIFVDIWVSKPEWILLCFWVSEISWDSCHMSQRVVLGCLQAFFKSRSLDQLNYRNCSVIPKIWLQKVLDCSGSNYKWILHSFHANIWATKVLNYSDALSHRSI